MALTCSEASLTGKSGCQAADVWVFPNSESRKSAILRKRVPHGRWAITKFVWGRAW